MQTHNAQSRRGASQAVDPRKKLSRIFAVLAILNIVTALGALSISQLTLSMLEAQQHGASTWNERVAELMNLRDVIAQMFNHIQRRN